MPDLRLWRRLELPPGNWWYVLSFYGTYLVADLGLQAMRSRRMGIPLASWDFVDALRPALAFDLFLILFWAVLLSAFRKRAARWVVTIAFHLTFLVVAALAIFNHVYFWFADIMLSGHTVDLLPLLVDSQIGKLIAGEVPPRFLVIGGVVLLVSNLVPPLLNRWFAPRWLASPIAERQSNAGPTRAVLALAVVLLALSVLPDGSGFARSNRSRVVAFGLDTVHRVTDVRPEGFDPPTLADLPIDTNLVDAPGGYRDGSRNRPNVVLVLVESLGARATTVHQPDLATTPNLAALAKESLVADRAYTVIPHTTKALIASHCGIAPPPWPFDANADEPGGIAARCLPSLLSDQGYATAYFQSATQHFEERDTMIDRFGFEDFYPLERLPHAGFSRVNDFGYEDAIMVDPSVAWAERAHRANRPFFLSYLTVTTHYDYGLPAGYRLRKFAEDDAHNRYLNGVRYTDAVIGRLLDRFKQAGLYDDTIFIITGDHGEGFYEHGRRGHNDVVWNEGLQVPLLINSPQSRRSPGRITTPVQQSQILPTVADQLGFDIEGARYPQGSMLKPAADPIFAACWDSEQCMTMIEGDMKFNHFFGYRPDEYFDLSTDPGERHNVIDRLDERAAQQKVRHMRVWLAEVGAAYELSRSAGRK